MQFSSSLFAKSMNVDDSAKSGKMILVMNSVILKSFFLYISLCCLNIRLKRYRFVLLGERNEIVYLAILLMEEVL